MSGSSFYEDCQQLEEAIGMDKAATAAAAAGEPPADSNEAVWSPFPLSAEAEAEAQAKKARAAEAAAKVTPNPNRNPNPNRMKAGNLPPSP